MPRFTAENRDANEARLDHVRAFAGAHDITPAQVALAWLVAQQRWIVLILGTRRAERIAENAGSRPARAVR
jgi:aryl-alcohol dehydrogenase-like predicted oxidoreductase